ncbi:unnamed protein product [Citrullus colocynthis]|uniref:Uncharacterized protein n=1 Tax=Citrullus colocynthis TaxID=252529 RepID=A0ABP0XU91_9ROSI
MTSIQKGAKHVKLKYFAVKELWSQFSAYLVALQDLPSLLLPSATCSIFNLCPFLSIATFFITLTIRPSNSNSNS